MKRCNRERGSCAMVGGIGCVVLILVVAIGGYIVYNKFVQGARDLAAGGVTVVVESLLDEAGFPKSEKAAAMEPVQTFAAKIKAGGVDLDQGMRVVKELGDSDAVTVIAGKTFEFKYIAASALDEAEKSEAIKTTRRFLKGVIDEKIPEAKKDEVYQLFKTETVDKDGVTHVQVKSSLTSDELTEALVTMKTAADEAGIAEKAFEFDLPGLIQSAIDNGMKVVSP